MVITQCLFVKFMKTFFPNWGVVFFRKFQPAFLRLKKAKKTSNDTKMATNLIRLELHLKIVGYHQISKSDFEITLPSPCWFMPFLPYGAILRKLQKLSKLNHYNDKSWQKFQKTIGGHVNACNLIFRKNFK